MTTRGSGALRAGGLAPVQASKACPKGHRLAGACWLAPVLHVDCKCRLQKAYAKLLSRGGAVEQSAAREAA